MWYLDRVAGVAPDRVILVFGVFQLVASGYVLWLLPDFFLRFSLLLLTHTLYRVEVQGVEHVPARGPALLVCNHLSHVDGFLVGACVQRFIRFMVYRPYFNLPVARQLLTMMRAIPVAGGNRQEVLASIAQARAELERGHVVCIFAEGAISRTGNLLPFKRGFERIVEGLDVPVIPVCLDRLWGSVFSFKQGRFFWKWPEQIPYPVSVSFGAPMPATTSAADARQAIAELSSDAMTRRLDRRSVLHRRVIRTAKRHWGRFAMADISGRELSYGRMLVAALMLSRWVRRTCDGQAMVGLLLPASMPAALANLAVLIAGKVPVNLNFTAGREAMAAAIAQCGITTVISAKQFLAKAKLDPPDGTVLLEDVMPTLTNAEKVRTFLEARLLPTRWLIRRYAPEMHGPDDLATVIFSSGSTGQPKGVMLSHRNVIANLEGMCQVFWVTPKDRMIGVLPFFHSFGFTGTLWFPLVSGFGTLFVPNPMDAKAVGELADKYEATILIGTPTFYQAYIRKCEPRQFRALRYGVVGAEKLREPIARGFRERFGIDLLEGYGCTEMAPVVSVNVPDVADAKQTGSKAGSVGHPLPGVVVRVVDPESTHAGEAGRAGPAAGEGPQPDARLSRQPLGHRRSVRRRLVRDRRHRRGRRRRVHPADRSAVAVQQDRRRDGAAPEDRGSRHRRARRPQLRGHGRARRGSRRAAGRLLHEGRAGRRGLGGAQRLGAAEAVGPQEGQRPPHRDDSRPWHGEGGLARREAAGGRHHQPLTSEPTDRVSVGRTLEAIGSRLSRSRRSRTTPSPKVRTSMRGPSRWTTQHSRTP